VEAQIVKLGMEISPIAARVAMDEGVDLTGVGATGRLGRISLEDVAHRAGRPVGARKDRKLISPRARKFAREKGIDPATLQGSGAEGRVLAADIASLGSSGVAGAFEIVRMSPMRKAIARQLSLSKSTIPHFYLRAQVCVDALLALREQTRRLEGQAFSVNDYLIRACALALRQVPDVNIQVHGDEIRRFAHADIAVAVATEKGLLTPIIRAAETKSVAAISREMRSLAESARAGSLKSEDYQGGSFSLSNLGMFGIDQFDAIVNPPQGAILAVGAARRKPVEANFALSFATVVELSLSCDHRAIDGAVGARFMAALRTLIEDPETLTRAA
jgi:pyruvate dehydrogenase E2 component (dihydrolipoamide acetyltransferase)